MKLYHLFCWEQHTAGGGMLDYFGSYESLEGAKAATAGGWDFADVAYVNEDGDMKVTLHGRRYHPSEPFVWTKPGELA